MPALPICAHATSSTHLDNGEQQQPALRPRRRPRHSRPQRSHAPRLRPRAPAIRSPHCRLVALQYEAEEGAHHQHLDNDLFWVCVGGCEGSLNTASSVPLRVRP